MQAQTVMERADGYARLSKNRGHVSNNCQIQDDEIRDHSEARGYQFGETFKDDDLSASKYTKKPRKDYDRLLEKVRAGETEIILITEMPRLYRRMEELLELINLSETTALKRIESTDGQMYLLHTAEGRHAARAAVNNAILESDRLSARGKRKKKALAKDGLPAGGSRPLGYTTNGMEIIEKEAAIIREIKNRLLDGEPTGHIIEDLNRRGITTAKGSHWCRHRIGELLKRRRYYGFAPGNMNGTRQHRKDLYEAKWPALFPYEDYDKVLVELKIRASAIRQRGTGRKYIGTGFYFCECGNRLTCSRKRRDKTAPLRPKYQCRTKDNQYQEVGCGGVSRSGLPLDDFVKEVILERLDTDGLYQNLAQLESDKELIGSLMTDLETRRNKLTDLVKDYGNGLLNREQFAIAKGEAETALEDAETRLNKELQSRTALTIDTSQDLRKVAETADIEWWRSIMEVLGVRVIVHKQTKRPYYKDLGRFDPDSVEIIFAA